MQKTLRKLCLIPVLLLVFAAADLPRTASAGQQPCFVNHWACPDGFYDCCCGVFQACMDDYSECRRICGP